MSNQNIMNGELLGKKTIVICPNCKKQFSSLDTGTCCKECSGIDYVTGKIINPIRKVELTIDLGLLFKESNELHNLKRDIKENCNLKVSHNKMELREHIIRFIQDVKTEGEFVPEVIEMNAKTKLKLFEENSQLYEIQRGSIDNIASIFGLAIWDNHLLRDNEFILTTKNKSDLKGRGFLLV
jgi:hypothetical protein